MRTELFIIGALVALMSAACGRGPTSPSATRLNIQPGLNRIEAIGFNISSNPDRPPCTSFAVGPYLNTHVDMRLEGNDWVGRSPHSGAGTIELRLQAAAVQTAHPRQQGMRGTIVGTAIDLGVALLPPEDVKMTFGPPAAVEGIAETLFYSARGTIRGSVTVSDSKGNSTMCTYLEFRLQPVTGSVSGFPNVLGPMSPGAWVLG